MKRTKALIALLTVVALLCGILPLSALAASVPVQKIVTDFNINIADAMKIFNFVNEKIDTLD